MRLLILTFALLLVFQAYSQTPGKVLLSAIVVDADSIPVTGVAIINSHTGKTIHTNEHGYFQTEYDEGDSLFIYHIGYERQFAGDDDNGRIIKLVLRVNELKQVDVNDKSMEDIKYFQQTIKDIKRLALKKKIADYDANSRQQRFIDQYGSLTKGFKPYFGPTVHVPFTKLVAMVSVNENKQQLKKLTSHYHYIKTKKKKQK